VKSIWCAAIAVRQPWSSSKSRLRTTDAFGPPHYAVTVKQQDRIIRGAKEWLRMLNDPRISYRFDVVEVLMKPIPAVNLIRGAFQVADDIYL